MFTKIFEETLPRFDGSSGTDWISTPIEASAAVAVPMFHVSGQERAFALKLQIQPASGSGSNSWRCQPVVLRNIEDHPRSWDYWTPPNFVGGANVCPFYFTEASLPMTNLYSVPTRYEHLALLFTRSGAGTLVLRVRAAVDRGA